jgi:uncharacterized phage protein gp47/JayE
VTTPPIPVDFTARDFAALREAMLEVASQRLPEWNDHSTNDLGVVLTELVAYAADLQLYYQDRIANEAYLDTAVERRSLVRLLRLIGYELEPPKPAAADLTLYFDPNFAGTVTINPGARFESTVKVGGKPVGFQYVRPPMAIELGSQVKVTVNGALYRPFDTLPVIQTEPPISNEVLGSSDGTPGQRFRLARSPLIVGQLTVTVDEGAGPHAWEVRDSLLYSGPNDEHCTVVRDVAADDSDITFVEFGDNVNGRVPRRGTNNIVAAYLVGGGPQGNVQQDTITKIVTPIPNLKLVTNKLPATGGSDAEATSVAARRGPKQFRAWGRAVTAADYVSHAIRFGVGKARARAPGWNRIELFIAPAGGGQPADTLKDDLHAYFEDKRMLTSNVEILDPAYVPVYVAGTLTVKPYFFQNQVAQQVQDAVRQVLAFDNVTFEDTIYLSDLYHAVAGIEGVEGLNITKFKRTSDTDLLPGSGFLSFGWNEIAVLGTLPADPSVPTVDLIVTGGRRGD